MTIANPITLDLLGNGTRILLILCLELGSWLYIYMATRSG
jgi:hypothetical protein